MGAEQVADTHARLRCKQCGKYRGVKMRHPWSWRRPKPICDTCWVWLTAR